jgi:uncharacterized membrane protein YebE (DUF533 family)
MAKVKFSDHDSKPLDISARHQGNYLRGVVDRALADGKITDAEMASIELGHCRSGLFKNTG